MKTYLTTYMTERDVEHGKVRHCIFAEGGFEYCMDIARRLEEFNEVVRVKVVEADTKFAIHTWERPNFAEDKPILVGDMLDALAEIDQLQGKLKTATANLAQVSASRDRWRERAKRLETQGQIEIEVLDEPTGLDRRSPGRGQDA